MKRYVIIVLMMAFLLLPVLVYVGILYHEEFARTTEDFGVFGDYIGGTAGTIVGLISIVLVYITYKSQVDFSRRQEKNISCQQFESTLFELLSQQQQIRFQLTGVIGENEEYHGHSYLHKFREELSDAMSDLNYESDLLVKDNEVFLKSKINDIYMDIYLPKASSVGHYFRNSYHIVKFIDSTSLVDNKNDYIGFLQAQLTGDELYLLAINGISIFGRNRMRSLLDKYSVLENIDAYGDPIMKKIISIFYPNTNPKYMRSTTRRIVFIGGVNGVGKTALSNELSKRLDNRVVLTCREIIEWNNPHIKHVGNVKDNQDVLLSNIPFFIDIEKQYLLNGHFCLINKEMMIEKIPLYVFETLSPSVIVVVINKVDLIRKRLLERDGIDYSLSLLEDFQEQELEYSKTIAENLGIKLLLYSGDNVDSIVEELSLIR